MKTSLLVIWVIDQVSGQDGVKVHKLARKDAGNIQH